MRGSKFPEFIAVVILCSLGRLAPPANASPIKTCAAAEVRSVEVLVDVKRKALHSATPAEITATGAADNTVTIMAFGPVLGSMDSSEVKTEFTCSQQGILLTATITRSAEYGGGAAKNVLWNPAISIEIALRRPEVVFQTTWRMRLTTGVELKRARTAPYPEQEYPITVTQTVRRASAQ